MQKRAICQSAFLNPRTLIVLFLSSIKTGAIHIALLCAAALSVHAGAIALVKPAVPSDGTWTVTGSLNTGRFVFTATLLANGMVLVAGGFDSNNKVLATAELYDPGERELECHWRSQHRTRRSHRDVAAQRHGACGRRS